MLGALYSYPSLLFLSPTPSRRVPSRRSLTSTLVTRLAGDLYSYALVSYLLPPLFPISTDSLTIPPCPPCRCTLSYLLSVYSITLARRPFHALFPLHWHRFHSMLQYVHETAPSTPNQLHHRFFTFLPSLLVDTHTAPALDAIHPCPPQPTAFIGHLFPKTLLTRRPTLVVVHLLGSRQNDGRKVRWIVPKTGQKGGEAW